VTNIEVIIIPDENLKNTAFGSYKTCESIYNVIASEHDNTKMTLCNDWSDLQSVVDRKPDLVVLTNKIIVINSSPNILKPIILITRVQTKKYCNMM